jgi:hypothetical protein
MTYQNLIKTVTAILEKVAILCFGNNVNISYFWSWVL